MGVVVDVDFSGMGVGSSGDVPFRRPAAGNAHSASSDIGLVLFRPDGTSSSGDEAWLL